ncbi:MAG: hypothetical protein A3H91_12455 [Gammaproteobacteria bacterium RIFCSPLOWO2_02_FULL_61_13]|nr:MAG: hypothetical protein A3H91_12455 [Gammaproteobacteria bacterium RIFCSPLOWO2_02_FULL_61_13]
MPEFTRPTHRLVQGVLRALDAAFLVRTHCYFGGGTRLVMALGEYRESADIDFLCADRAGYRELRSTVSVRSLGHIARSELTLVREVIADRYGIRTVIETAGVRIKFEIVLEGRIGIDGASDDSLGVPALGVESCFAEKFLANADRWGDDAFLNRDIIDLAFMRARWGEAACAAGRAVAREAYGRTVDTCTRRAATLLLEDPAYRRRCVAGLSVSDTRTLGVGLRALAARRGGKVET